MKKSNIIHFPIFYFVLITVSFWIISCNPIKNSNTQEGIIEFDTKGVDENHPLYSLAPNSASLKFKNEKFTLEMSVMGLFNTSIIGNIKTKTLVQTVKFMNINQACIENEADITKSNLDYPIKILETNETKEILGLKCYKAKVTKLNLPSETFDVWYTKELGVENCNNLTVYAPIKGMLLDYRIQKMGMELHFKASSYKPEKLTDNIFEIPASMKIISIKEMTDFITEIQ